MSIDMEKSKELWVIDESDFGCAIVGKDSGGVLYGYQETINKHEAELLCSAHNKGANTYLEACEIEPELKKFW